MHREISRVGQAREFGSALDLNFDVAALQFKFGNVFFD